MRRQTKYFLTAAAAALLVSCSGEDYHQDMDTILPGGTQEIRFEMVYATATAVAVTDTPQTRVTTDGDYNSTWTNGDKVGVYIVKGSGGLQASGNWVDNMEMTYNNGNWTYTFPTGKEYYPSDGELLHFYAYYPYVSGLADPTKFTFSVQTDQSTAANLSKSDLLMAATMNVGKSGNSVPLAFSHVFTMVEISAISGGVGGQMSANVVPTLEGCRTGATVNLAAGTATASGNVGAITMCRVEQPTDANYLTKYTYRALVPAQTVEVGTELFRFTQTQGSVNRSLSHKPSAQVALTRGEVKPYNITLQPTIDPNHAYAVGDYYPYNGLPVLGVVFEVSNEGKHDKVVGLHESGDVAWRVAEYWSFYTSASNGWENMYAVDQYIKNNSLGQLWSNFPAFNWVHGLNPANTDYSDTSATNVWYLPAKDELQHLYCAWNGEDPQIWYSRNAPFGSDATARAAFNAKLTAAGGTGLSDMYYWSSTSSYSSFEAWVVSFLEGHTINYTNGYSNNARCVLAF